MLFEIQLPTALRTFYFGIFFKLGHKFREYYRGRNQILFSCESSVQLVLKASEFIFQVNPCLPAWRVILKVTAPMR